MDLTDFTNFSLVNEIFQEIKINEDLSKITITNDEEINIYKTFMGMKILKMDHGSIFYLTEEIITKILKINIT